MTWWQVLLLVWGVGSFPFAFVMARFLRAPAGPPRPRIEFAPKLVEPPERLVERPEYLVERRDDQVA